MEQQRWCGVVAAVVFAAACGPSKHGELPVETPVQAAVDAPASKTPPPPEPDAAPAPALTLTIDGQPVEIGSVIATQDRYGITIQLASSNYTCQEWVDGYREHAPDDEILISIQLKPNLSPAGEHGWAISGTAFQGTTSSAQDGGDPVPGATLDPSAGGHSHLDVALDLETLEDVPKRAHLAGTIDALGCGPLSWAFNDPEPVPAALPGVVLKVAGQEMPVGGAALVVGERGSQLVLASRPVTCVDGSGTVNDHHFLSASDSAVELELTWYGASTTPDHAVLGGDLLGKGGETMTFPDGRLTATPSTAGKKAKHVAITLGGATKLGDYPVELSGTVDATICR
jgi:hypothetical protein